MYKNLNKFYFQFMLKLILTLNSLEGKRFVRPNSVYRQMIVTSECLMDWTIFVLWLIWISEHEHWQPVLCCD